MLLKGNGMMIGRRRKLSLGATMKAIILLYFPIFIIILTVFFVSSMKTNRNEILLYMDLQKNEVSRTLNAYIGDFERRNFSSDGVMERYGTILERKDETKDFLRVLKDSMSIGYATMSNVKWIAILEDGEIHTHNTGNIAKTTIGNMAEGLTRNVYSLFGRGRFYRDEETDEVFYLRAIYGPNELKVLGFLIACIDKTALVPYFSAIEAETGNHYAIQTFSGDTVYEYSRCRPNVEYVTDYSPLIDYDLVLRQDVDMTAQQSAFRHSYYISISIMLIALILMFAVLSLFMKDIHRQIGYVLSRIRQISNSDFSIPETEAALTKEIEEISDSINSMALRIDTLIKENAIKERNRQQMEIELLQAKYAVLQSQVNPHFLYNVLESINGQALLNDDEETASMICHLADFFRGVLDNSGKEWTVADEIDFMTNYLQLYQSIYPDRLSVKYEVDNEILPYRIPSFLLQPIIENSIVNGMEEKIGQCTIRISCTRRNGIIRFSIRDDGMGMDPERLKEVREMLYSTRKGRVGLPNVADRIRLRYGEYASFSIESEFGIGTEVTIEIKEGL